MKESRLCEEADNVVSKSEVTEVSESVMLDGIHEGLTLFY